MGLRFCLWFCLVLPTALPAQHCGFDFKALIIIKFEGKTPANVHIQLLDSLQNEVFSYNHHTQKYDAPFVAWRNGKSNKYPLFPFAGEEYVLVVNHQRFRQGEKFYLRIKGYGNKTRVLPIQREHLYPLCGRYDLEEYPKEEVYGYVPEVFWVK